MADSPEQEARFKQLAGKNVIYIPPMSAMFFGAVHPSTKAFVNWVRYVRFFTRSMLHRSGMMCSSTPSITSELPPSGESSAAIDMSIGLCVRRDTRLHPLPANRGYGCKVYLATEDNELYAAWNKEEMIDGALFCDLTNVENSAATLAEAAKKSGIKFDGVFSRTEQWQPLVGQVCAPWGLSVR